MIWIGVSVALTISVTAFVIYQVNASIAASVEHKSAKTTTATVVSVTEIQKTHASEAQSKEQKFKVCFTFDNLDQVEVEMRQGYESAETQRATREGPRCTETTKKPLAKSLSSGSKLSVDYLLENEYHLDVVAVTAHGEEL